MSVLRFLPQPWLRGLAPVLLAAAAAGVVLGCGGGTSQVQVFVPSRLMVLGEETSVLNDTARSGNAQKYALNGVDTLDTTVTPNVVTTPACAQLAIVPQWVAARYGMTFAECKAATSTATVNAFDYAVAGALLEDPANGLAAQIDRAGALSSSDLFTVWFGVNDIIEIYRRFAAGTYTAQQAYAEAERRGIVAAQLISEKLLATGAHALVFTAIDVGLTPYANARTTSADPDAPTALANAQAITVLAELSSRFNSNLRVAIDPQRFDGRNYGLVFPDEVVQAFTANPTGYGNYLVTPYNVTDAVCTVDLLGCSDATDTAGVNNGGMVVGAVYNSYFWASDRWPSYPLHYQVGVQAQSRLTALPF